MMIVTSRMWLTSLVYFLTFATMTKSKPIPIRCTETGATDLLAISLAESVHFPIGVEVTQDKGVSGYRFDPEAKLLGVDASEVMTNCVYFPTEFSIIVTFKKQHRRNENEFLLTLLGQDRRTILLAVRLQRDRLHFDYVSGSLDVRETASLRSDRIVDGKWHTIVITVTQSNVKFTLDCLTSINENLEEPFPTKLNTQGSRFHIASRRRRRNRFTVSVSGPDNETDSEAPESSLMSQQSEEVGVGMPPYTWLSSEYNSTFAFQGLLRQVKFVPGADASIHLCSKPETNMFPPWLGAAKADTIPSLPGTATVQIDHQDETRSCDATNEGQLLYKPSVGHLQMCEGERWKRFATKPEKLDYIVDFSDLITKSKTFDVEVFSIEGEGLFLAFANQGRNRSMDSTIYKWDESRKVFYHHQSIKTDTARDWEFFTIENEHFLAVANQGNDENSPSAKSVIFKWERRRRLFVPFQYIQTMSARCWKSFQIDDKHYLVVANYAGARGQREKSWVWVWEPFQRIFSKYQSLDTIGAYDFEYFKIGSNHYLAAANSYDGFRTNVDSVIYHWRLSNFVPLHYVETSGATDWEHFSISGRHFLAVANYYNTTSGINSYVADSVVYEVGPARNQFTKIQTIPTHGALDFEFFTVGRDSYLVAASSSDSNKNHISTVYRWQGVEQFVPVHNISTGPCADWEQFTSNQGEHYLVSANVNSRISKVLQLLTY